MQSDWAVRNWAKIGTETLYIEIVMECFPGLDDLNGEILSSFTRRSRGLPVIDPRIL